MPSGHSQIAFAFSTYLLLKEFQNKTLTQLKTLLYILLAFSVSYSRIYFNCHTIQQTLIGSVIGLILGLMGFYYKDKMGFYLPIIGFLLLCLLQNNLHNIK